MGTPDRRGLGAFWRGFLEREIGEAWLGMSGRLTGGMKEFAGDL